MLLSTYNQIMLKINKLLRTFSSIDPHKLFMNSLGFKTNSLVFNPSVPELYQMAIAHKQQEDSQLKMLDVSSNGALCTYSKQKHSKKHQNSRIVKDQETSSTVNWGKYNISMDIQSYNLAQQLAIEYLNHKGNCIVVDGYAGWDPKHRMKVRTFCGRSNQALFMKNMLIKPTQEELLQEFTKGVDINILNASEMAPAKFISGIDTDNITAINLRQKRVSILGNESVEEMKKSIFKIFQYYYPRKNILPLHATATLQKNGETTLFFNLQQAEKTNLGVTSKNRKLIGADEIAWGQNGIFNLQGGCYTKILNSNHKIDSQVESSIRYGALVQNSIFYPNSRNINFYDVKESPNAKTSFPLNFFKNSHLPSMGKSPSNIVFFTCDARGVLPPIAKLTPEQAYYHFVSGYTCRVNEKTHGQHIHAPKIRFNACYGEQYLAFHPFTYAKLLFDKIKEHKTNVWIVNTGWTQGKYGQGQRLSTQDSQKLVQAIINGQLTGVSTYKSSYFNFQVPTKIHGINEDLLYPERGWGLKAQYDDELSKLVILFAENYHYNLRGKMKDVEKIMEKGAPTLI